MQVMLFNKSSIEVSLFPSASWSHHLCLHLKGFLFSFSLLLFFFSYCNNLSACRICSQSYASVRKPARKKCLPFYPLNCHISLLFTLNPFPQPPPTQTWLICLPDLSLGWLWQLFIGIWLLFNSPAWKRNISVSSILVNTSLKSSMWALIALPGLSPSLCVMVVKARMQMHCRKSYLEKVEHMCDTFDWW